LIGDLIRIRYEVIEELPSTAVFDSYVARDRVRNTDVCLRMVRLPFANEPDFVQTLGKVVERAKTLDHPNIVRVYEIDEHEGRPFVVCELVRGSTLSERIRRLAPFSPSVAVEIAIGICEALEHAATAGIPHGDLCSDHVIATLEGRIAVMDFGLWECYGASENAGALVLGRMAPYLSPEVINGDMPSLSSDVYAMGVILFELLTGLMPFSGLTPASVIAKHATQPVPSARAMNPAVPHVLDEIVQKALAKDPAERYSSASAMLSDLRKLLDALRFGKRLDFPLEGAAVGPPQVRPAKTHAEKKAQKMGGAVHADTFGKRAAAATAQTAGPRRIPLAAEPPPDDVPWWLRGLVWAGAGMIALFVIWYVFFSFTQKKSIDAPNLIGMSMTEARRLASGLGLELVIAGEEYNERYPQPKTVFFMDPAAGTPIKEGATIQVKLSAGTRLVEVPDVRGLPLAEARVRFDAVGLQMDPTIRREAARGISEGLIIKTDPGPWEKVDRGSQITITISTGNVQPDRPVASADDLIRNTWSLQFTVRSTDTVMVRVEMTDARNEPQIVYESEHSNGDVVDLPLIEGLGKTATFRVYYNNNLEMTYPNRRGTQD